MENIHRFIGEGLFVLYFLVMIVAFIMARRNQATPSWLIGIAHGVLALQVALGVILLASGGLSGVPWYHPVLGIITLLALGISRPLHARLQPGYDVAAMMGIVGILALITQMAARIG
jgi:heme A synthase